MSVPATGPITAAAGEFRVGRVFRRSFGILSRHFVKFIVITGIATVPNLFLIGAGTPKGANETFRIGDIYTGWAMLPAFLALVLGVLCQAAILHGAFQDMRGRDVEIGQSLRRGLSRFWPVIGLSLCQILGTVFGMILLVVPGLMLASSWFVAMPACVVEQRGPIPSLKRSSELTKGHRWKIFGLFLLITVVSGIVSGLILPRVLLPLGEIVNIAGTFLWKAFSTAIYAIIVIVTYHDLRVAKEGTDIERIAAVFD